MHSVSIMRWIMAIFYLIAGFLHLKSPDGFLPIVPDWVPASRQVILATGACEIVGALALLSERFRAAAGILLALYAICVFPANIKHAVEGIQVGGLPQSWWYHAPRLSLQPILVWWALFSAEVVHWPFGAGK
jgi:uncharacterized membrane protein